MSTHHETSGGSVDAAHRGDGPEEVVIGGDEDDLVVLAGAQLRADVSDAGQFGGRLFVRKDQVVAGAYFEGLVQEVGCPGEFRECDPEILHLGHEQPALYLAHVVDSGEQFALALFQAGDVSMEHDRI